MPGELQESTVLISTSRSFVQQPSVLTFPVPGLGWMLGHWEKLDPAAAPGVHRCRWYGGDGVVTKMPAVEQGSLAQEGVVPRRICWLAQEFLSEGSVLEPRPGQRVGVPQANSKKEGIPGLGTHVSSPPTEHHRRESSGVEAEAAKAWTTGTCPRCPGDFECD